MGGPKKNGAAPVYFIKRKAPAAHIRYRRATWSHPNATMIRTWAHAFASAHAELEGQTHKQAGETEITKKTAFRYKSRHRFRFVFKSTFWSTGLGGPKKNGAAPVYFIKRKAPATHIRYRRTTWSHPNATMIRTWVHAFKSAHAELEGPTRKQVGETEITK